MGNLSDKTLRPEDVSLLAIDVKQDPFPIYSWLRENHPVCRTRENLWAISPYSAVQEALKRPEIFSSAGVLKIYQPEWLHPESQRDYSIFSQDPPVHTRNRAIINKAFVGRVVNRLEPHMRATAAHLITQIQSGVAFDFMRGFSAPFAASIITEVTGTKDSQTTESLLEWLELSEILTPIRPPDAHVKALETAQIRQRHAIRAAIKIRREFPQQDLITELLTAEIDGEALSDGVIISLFELLLGAGFDTVSYSLCHCMIRFAREPELLIQLRRSPAQIPAFLEELWRFDPPTHGLLRETTQGVNVLGTEIPEGALVLLLVGAANRDPTKFPNPDIFQIGRSNIREHVAFGTGPHACIGAALARLEAKVALELLVQEFSSVECPPDQELSWISSINIHGTRDLPLVLQRG